MTDVVVVESTQEVLAVVGETQLVEVVAAGPAGPAGPPGSGVYNLDGGFADSTYGGILPIDCGGA